MIYIVRHGQTDWNIQRRTQGHSDIPLNDTGRAQARALIPQIQTLGIDRIIVSDLSRARETAEIINEGIHKPTTIDVRLREINYGDFEGQIFPNPEDKIWNTFNYDPNQFHAESKEHLYQRVKDFFGTLPRDENILIVSHGGTIRMMGYYAEHPDTFDLALYLEKYLGYHMRNTALFQWDGESSLKLINTED